MSANTLASKLRTRESLWAAWRHVRASAAVSDSSETREDAHRFERHVDRELRTIQSQLRTGSYRFSEAQAIVKKRKGKTSRPIVVAPVRDRVVQRALLEVVLSQPSVERALATPWSFGGRRKVGVPDAISAACTAIAKGGSYYIKSDISGFFTKIPRPKAIDALAALLPDDSLRDILEAATSVELRDPLFISDDLKLFPTHELGVAQGCCLSPLLGNVLLRDIDEEIGQINVNVCLLRYIDDVLLIGPSREVVHRAFRKARSEFATLGFDLYDPAGQRDKAAEGSTRRGFDYLGCNISPGYIVPSADARKRLKDKVRTIINDGRHSIERHSFETTDSYAFSMITVLGELSNVIKGWANQYAFCNADSIMTQLDAFVDEQLGKYFASYSRHRAKTPGSRSRRMLGVRLFSDGNKKPILPLAKSPETRSK